MYIDKITLTNIRGFKHLDFSLARPDGSYAGWTVFTGDNGGGKSTLLKALVVGVNQSSVYSLMGGNKKWLTQYEFEGSIKIKLSNDGTTFIQFRRNQLQNNGLNVSRVESWTGTQSEDSANTFVCAYGPFRRVSGSSLEAMNAMSDPDTASTVTLFDESASLAEVDRWMRQLDHETLGGKPGAKEKLDLLTSILNDGLLPNGITIDRVDYDGLWLKDKNGLQLSWGDMSDGYRSALALLADILRHMIEAYGVEDLTGVDADGKLFIKRSGVVLIDEIDAHLHPSWQRDIGFWLKKHFPAIQFLVTTHSPIICQAADPNGIFVLPSPASDDEPRAMTEAEYNEIVASKSDAILRTPAFNLKSTRSDEADKKRLAYSNLASKEMTDGLSPMEQIQLAELDAFVSADKS